MEIILKEDINNVGHKDELLTVKNGFGRNHLIPRGLAILATPSAKKIHAENKKQRAHKEEKLRNDALALAAKMEDLVITIGAKTSSTGKIFGSVNTIQLAEMLKEKGFDVERKNIAIKEESVKEIGKYKATVRLFKDVKVNFEFEVVSE